MNGAGQILLRVPASAVVQAPRCSGPAAGASAAELRARPQPVVPLVPPDINQAYGCYRVLRGGLNRHQEATAA
jgi:hypothetical protein